MKSSKEWAIINDKEMVDDIQRTNGQRQELEKCTTARMRKIDGGGRQGNG